MSRGSKKDPGFATRCFGAEEKTAQNNVQRLKKRLCSFSRPHCGAEKKLEVEKKDMPRPKTRWTNCAVQKKTFRGGKKRAPRKTYLVRKLGRRTSSENKQAQLLVSLPVYDKNFKQLQTKIMLQFWELHIKLRALSSLNNLLVLQAVKLSKPHRRVSTKTKSAAIVFNKADKLYGTSFGLLPRDCWIWLSSSVLKES